MQCDFEQTTDRDENGEATFRCRKCRREVFHCKSEAHKIYANCRAEGAPRPLTLLEMAANAATAAGRFAASGGETVHSDVFAARMAQCRACPMHDATLNRCNDCGCFLALKAWLPSEICRLGRWPT
jgi:hypothetical protein